jgi:hypothetical protein
MTGKDYVIIQKWRRLNPLEKKVVMFAIENRHFINWAFDFAATIGNYGRHAALGIAALVFIHGDHPIYISLIIGSVSCCEVYRTTAKSFTEYFDNMA